jgi:NAD(P) transhydrogenase subunit alpha
MTIVIAIPKETALLERRVAFEPGLVKKMQALGVALLMEKGAGEAAFLPDAQFQGVEFVEAASLWQRGQVFFMVQAPTMEVIAQLPKGSLLIAMVSAYRHPERVEALAKQGVTTLAMELLPRISRAQAMDVLSSQATVAGYRAVLQAAQLSPRFFPMLTTAAGTIRPATVLVLGAGVAGLQAIATAKRLGAIVEAYDVRAATKEQVQSLGGKFIELPVAAEGQGGYARELTAEEKAQQQALLTKHIQAADAIIATAAVPGRPAPKIITEAMVQGMKPGAVIVDIAAESGGNCAVTVPGEIISYQNVTIAGPLNIASTLPYHASEMYARNLYNLLLLIVKNGEIVADWEDEILKGALLTKDGQIVHAQTRELVEKSIENKG